jgi:hypothetical protein
MRIAIIPKNGTSFQWKEFRGNELFIMIAEKEAGEGEWRFFERSTWEVRWYPIASCAQFVARAERLAHAC